MNKLEDMDQYASSWEWTKERSKYHFDYSRRDQPGEYYIPLGRFAGDWSKDLADALAKDTRAITWANRKDSPYYKKEDGTFEQSPMIKQEEYDLVRAGYDVNLELTEVVENSDMGPVFTKMYEFFGIENPWVRLHLQHPGQMFNLHIDKLYGRSEDPNDVVRIVVNLTDWEPGQFYQYGTYTLSHWRAGDIHTFDWPNVPHATANASRSIRPTLMMTGTKTARTREILAAATEFSIYNI